MSDNPSHTRIKKLSPLLINQLAAGEVVTRPAAVVKELLENAIDGGAAQIEVRITQGGMGMIEVIDNGAGIHPDDMIMAITRHATSKVADVANLHGINTLGFRGEALAATAAVSRLTLISSYDDSGIGRQLQVAGVLAEPPTLLPVVRSRGTTVTVKDLYFNVPARRGNLKSIATEFTHIETIVCEVALARADITLSLYHDNKKRLSLSAQPTQLDAQSNSSDGRLPLSRLEQALGVPLSDTALPVLVDLSSLMQPSTTAVEPEGVNTANISGWLWPKYDQQQALVKLLYINGRLVKEPIISNQLRQLAQSAQLDGLGYALYFDLPAHWLNVNVHPSKQRIKISPLNNILAHLSHSIRLKLNALDNVQSSIRQDLDDDISYNAANGSLSKASPLLKKALSQQVQTPKHAYHSKRQQDQDSQAASKTKDSADATALINNIKSPNLAKAFLDEPSLANSLGDSPALPYCLEVITKLPNNIICNPDQPLALWLLFYSKGQLRLIAQKDWQTNLKLMLITYSLNIDKLSIDAAVINQQFSRLATQMSTPDLIAFIIDVETLLEDYSSSTIDSQQLVALMLSSPAD